MRGACIHCGQDRALKARSLCGLCYLAEDIKALYPPKVANGNAETMADLDALVAERSKPENLPKWWRDEAKKVEARLRSKDNHRARDRKRRSRSP